MNHGKYVFAQIIDFVPKYYFNHYVAKYRGDYRSRNFSCWNQFLALTFGHLTFRESLRDIVTCLHAQQRKLYHLGFRSQIARNTFSHANRNRDWRIYRDFCFKIIADAQALYAGQTLDDPAIDFPVYALDSTLVRLCINIFSWASYRKTIAGIKMHTVFDVASSIPSVIYISDGRDNDNQLLKQLFFEAGALYVMDRAYFDLKSLYRIHKTPAYFVVRVKRTINFQRQYSHDVKETPHIIFDQKGVMRHWKSRQAYPDTLRLVKVVDPVQESPIYLLTNNFEQSAQEISKIYQSRWKVELFFKWIKQHLRIQSLWGENENAVKTQIYSAISAYVILAIIRKKLQINHSMHQILQIVSISMLDKTPLNQLLIKTNTNNDSNSPPNQLSIWEF